MCVTVLLISLITLIHIKFSLQRDRRSFRADIYPSAGVLKTLFQCLHGQRHAGLTPHSPRFSLAIPLSLSLSVYSSQGRVFPRKGVPLSSSYPWLLVGWAEWISYLAVQSPLEPTAITLPSCIKYEQALRWVHPVSTLKSRRRKLWSILQVPTKRHVDSTRENTGCIVLLMVLGVH